MIQIAIEPHEIETHPEYKKGSIVSLAMNQGCTAKNDAIKTPAVFSRIEIDKGSILI